MLERQLQHPAGRFMRCRKCGAEPRHILSHGYTRFENVTRLDGASSIRHALECGCGARTARHADLALAEAQWGADFAQLALPLHASRRPRHAAVHHPGGSAA